MLQCKMMCVGWGGGGGGWGGMVVGGVGVGGGFCN